MQRVKHSKAGRRQLRCRARLWNEWRGGGVREPECKGGEEVGAVVAKVLKGLRLDEGVASEELTATWRKVAGGSVAEYSTPVSLRRGCLTVRVLQPAMRFYLEQSQGSLLQLLQAKMGREVIGSIRWVIG